MKTTEIAEVSKTDSADKAKQPVVFLRGFTTTLRPLHLSDAPILTRWINDPEVRVNLSTQFPCSELNEEEFIRNSLSRGQSTTLMIEVDGRPIGVMGLHSMNHIHGTATTGAMIGEKDCWGKGYGTDAKMALLDWAFNQLNLRKIKSEAFTFNKRSVNYSLHCGYVSEGVRKQEVFINGKYWDIHMLAVTKKTWLPHLRIWKKTKGKTTRLK